MAAPAASFQSIPFQWRLQLPTASVSSIHGCDESRQTPIGIEASGSNTACRPGGLAAPEERWCRNVSNG